MPDHHGPVRTSLASVRDPIIHSVHAFSAPLRVDSSPWSLVQLAPKYILAQLRLTPASSLGSLQTRPSHVFAGPVLSHSSFSYSLALIHRLLSSHPATLNSLSLRWPAGAMRLPINAHRSGRGGFPSSRLREENPHLSPPGRRASAVFSGWECSFLSQTIISPVRHLPSKLPRPLGTSPVRFGRRASCLSQ
jgi:hypothetical protein